VVAVSEDLQPDAGPTPPVIPDISPDVQLASPARLTDRVVSRLSDQARLTAQPGMADLTPLRELLSELMEEARRVRPRERIARALRQAADIIDPPDG